MIAEIFLAIVIALQLTLVVLCLLNLLSVGRPQMFSSCDCKTEKPAKTFSHVPTSNLQKRTPVYKDDAAWYDDEMKKK